MPKQKMNLAMLSLEYEDEGRPVGNLQVIKYQHYDYQFAYPGNTFAFEVQHCTLNHAVMQMMHTLKF